MSIRRQFPIGVARVWPWLAALASGLLLALCFPPFDQGWLCWVALTPLVSAVWFSDASPLRSFGMGYATGLIFFWITFEWLTEVTTLGWFIFAFYLALYPAIWALYLAIVAKPREGTPPGSEWLSSASNLCVAMSGAAAWVGLEWIRGVLFTGFGWNGLGIALHDSIAIIQIADIAGVGGLSFLVAMVNIIAVASVRRIIREVGQSRIRPHYDFTIAITCVAAAFAYGVRKSYEKPENQVPVKVAAVQANIPQRQTWGPEFEMEIVERYRWLSDAAIAKEPNLLIWPEAALPRPLLNHEDMKAEAIRILQLAPKMDFLLGSTHYDYSGSYNSAISLGPEGGIQIYHKIHLVPFGEFIPFRDSFPLFAWVVGDQVPGDFDAGTEPVVFTLQSWPIKVAPLICFEDTLGDLTRQFALKDAELLVTVTNDGWFNESVGSQQHLINAVFRSAETKLPMVRAANTGVTCIIDRLGRVVNVLADENGRTFVEGFLFDEIQVPVEPPKTFYTLYGDLFSLVCLFGSLVVVRTRMLRFRRNSQRIALNSSTLDPSHSAQ